MNNPTRYLIDYGDILKPAQIYFTPAFNPGTPITINYTYGETTLVKVTGVQVEAGKNMSYFRPNLGAGLIAGSMIQKFNPKFSLFTEYSRTFFRSTIHYIHQWGSKLVLLLNTLQMAM